MPAIPVRPIPTGRSSRPPSRNNRLFAILAALLALAGCETAPPPDRLTLSPARFADLPGWSDDRHGAALTALRRSCERLAKLRDEAALGVGGMARDWREPCAAVAAISPDHDAAARIVLERWFVPFAATNNGSPQGLFTGYYEPELRGAKTRGGRYTVPLYGRPADLVTVDLGRFRDELKGQRIVGRVRQGALQPYATRAEIEAGALQGLRHEDGGPLELVWVDDAVDAFFLQIQGSGRVVFEDGSVLRVGYAERNGHPYVAIGRELVAQGVMTREQVSMQSIRDWLSANADKAPALMNRNPSFVFFRPLPSPSAPEDGPFGSEGVPLTPGRSLAVDRNFLPMGLPVWLDAEDPLDPRQRVRRLLVAQDTGGAIRGPVRGDVFWGFGADAAERAGRMRSAGRYWILLPRAVAARQPGVSANVSRGDPGDDHRDARRAGHPGDRRG